MTRRYDDTVDVRRRDEAPGEFLWRGRFYVVRDVLAHWVEVGAWWDGDAAHALLGTDVAPGALGPPGSGCTATVDGMATVGNAVGDSLVARPIEGRTKEMAVGAVVNEAEREVWRVEASAGRAMGSGVYDLCFDWSVGVWTLTRTID